MKGFSGRDDLCRIPSLLWNLAFQLRVQVFIDRVSGRRRRQDDGVLFKHLGHPLYLSEGERAWVSLCAHFVL